MVKTKKRTLKGTSISAKDLKLVHVSAYKKTRDKQIGDWVLDESLTRPTVSVYYNNKINQAIIVHRGTEGTLSDWSNNLQYVAGTNKYTKRYKDSYEVQKAAEAKYPNLLTTGHSQGGIYTKIAKDQKKVININPASLGETTEGTTIRSTTDPVSILAGLTNSIKDLFKSPSNKTNITTSAKFNPLQAHSLDILDELGNQQLGGRLFGTNINETNNDELDLLMKKYKIKNYHGCFIKDQLPHKLKNGFYIINLNGSSHWTVLLKDYSKYYYFDSFGFICPVDVEDKIPREYTYSNKQIQTEPSTACGFYVVSWIKYMSKNKNKMNQYKKFIDSFHEDQPVNEVILKRLL